MSEADAKMRYSYTQVIPRLVVIYERVCLCAFKLTTLPFYVEYDTYMIFLPM